MSYKFLLDIALILFTTKLLGMLAKKTRPTSGSWRPYCRPLHRAYYFRLAARHRFYH